MLSNPTDCDMDNGICLRHYPRHMLQIFSLKLAKIPVGAGRGGSTGGAGGAPAPPTAAATMDK